MIYAMRSDGTEMEGKGVEETQEKTRSREEEIGRKREVIIIARGV